MFWTLMLWQEVQEVCHWYNTLYIYSIEHKIKKLISYQHKVEVVCHHCRSKSPAYQKRTVYCTGLSLILSKFHQMLCLRRLISIHNKIDHPKVKCLNLDPLIFHPLKTNNKSSNWSAQTADWKIQTCICFEWMKN